VTGFVDFGEGKDTDAFHEFTEASDLSPNLPLSLAKSMMSPIATSSDPADENSFRDAMLRVLALPSWIATLRKIRNPALRNRRASAARSCGWSPRKEDKWFCT
jgi:hypothetical protein